MKRRNLLKKSGMTAGSVLVFSHLISSRGHAESSSEDCSYSGVTCGTVSIFQQEFIWAWSEFNSKRDQQVSELNALRDSLDEAANGLMMSPTQQYNAVKDILEDAGYSAVTDQQNKPLYLWMCDNTSIMEQTEYHSHPEAQIDIGREQFGVNGEPSHEGEDTGNDGMEMIRVKYTIKQATCTPKNCEIAPPRSAPTSGGQCAS